MTTPTTPPAELRADGVLALLGIQADEAQVHWARTIRLGDAGSITIIVQLDLAKLTGSDRDFIRGLAGTLRALADLHAEPTP